MESFFVGLMYFCSSSEQFLKIEKNVFFYFFTNTYKFRLQIQFFHPLEVVVRGSEIQL